MRRQAATFLLLFCSATATIHSRFPRAAPGTDVGSGGLAVEEVISQESNAPQIAQPSSIVAPVLRPPPGWGPPSIPDPPGTPIGGAGSTVEETLTVDSGPGAGGGVPPPAPPPPPGGAAIVETSIISSSGISKKKYGGYGYQKYGGGYEPPPPPPPPIVVYKPQPSYVPEYTPYVKKQYYGGAKQQYSKGSLMPPWLWPSHEEEQPHYGKKYGYYG